MIALQLRESERARAEIHCPFRKIEGGVKTFDSSLRKEDASKHAVGTKKFVRFNCTGEQSGTFSILKEGAWFSDVSVEGFDNVAVLVFDDAALELEGEGEAAVVKSEIIGEKSEALDGFVLGEIGREAPDFGIDQGMNPGMGNHFFL